MKKLINAAKMVVVGMFVAALAATGVQTNQAHAQAVPDPNIIALEIVPVCADIATNSAQWKVTNKNTADVNIDWNNTQHAQQGSFSAAPGDSTLLTYFDATDPNNTTQFEWAGNVTQTNAKNEACQPAQPPVDPACIDGFVQQNLVVTWDSFNTVTVHTLNNQPLCADVPVYFSSYTMPDNYNGGPFYDNPTAIPQSVFHSVSATLPKGTDGLSTLTVFLPSFCKNIQLDVYYGPEITTVGADGHGTQNIESKVYLSQGECMPAPGMGGGGGLPETPQTPAAETEQSTAPAAQTQAAPIVAQQPALPAELPKTGSSPANIAWLVALLLAAGTYGAVYAARRRMSSVTKA